MLANGPIKVGAAYMQGNGVVSNTGGAITDSQFAREFGTGSNHDRQRTFGAGASYSLDAAMFGAVWTQTRLDNNDIAGYSNVFNNFEVNARYAVTPALALGAAYTYTTGRVTEFSQPSEKTKFHQFGLQVDYALSKRTDFHVETIAQIGSASGDALTPNAAIANSNGAFGASSSSRQVAVSTGIRHRF